MSEPKKKSNIPESLKNTNKPPEKADQYALMSIAFGVIGIAFSCAGYGIIFGILAVVFGFLGLKSKEHRNLAIGGILLGILCAVLMVAVVIMDATNAPASSAAGSRIMETVAVVSAWY